MSVSLSVENLKGNRANATRLCRRNLNACSARAAKHGSRHRATDHYLRYLRYLPMGLPLPSAGARCSNAHTLRPVYEGQQARRARAASVRHRHALRAGAELHPLPALRGTRRAETIKLKIARLRCVMLPLLFPHKGPSLIPRLSEGLPTCLNQAATSDQSILF